MAIFTYKIFQSWLFYFMLAHFTLVVFLLTVNIKELWRAVKKIDKKIWLLLLLIFLVGFYWRNAEYWLGTHTDGYVAQESAHLWVLHGQFVKSCALGNHADCKIFEQVLAPPGYPLIIALAHLAFGIHSLNASIVSAILSSLTIILVFLIAYLIFEKEEVGLYAALIFSLIPLNIINSQTGESRPTGLFFVALTVLFYLLALRNNRLITWFLAITSLSYAIYVRQESYILVPLLVVFFIVFKWQDVKRFFKNVINKVIDYKALIWPVVFSAIFIVLQLPVLKWLLFNNPYSTYQGGGFFALHYKGLIIQGSALFWQLFNVSPAGYHFFHYNILSSVIFILAAGWLLFRPTKKKIFILSLFWAYFLVYSLMFDGNIQGTGQLTTDYFRRSLMFHLPYAIIAGYGWYFLSPLKKRNFLPANLLVVGLLSALILSYWGGSIFYKQITPSARLSYFRNLYLPGHLFKDVRATKEGDRSLIYPAIYYWSAIDKTPNGCHIIFSQYMLATSDYFKDNQRKAVSIDLINNNTEKLFLREFQQSNCLIYLSDYRCLGNLQNDYGCNFLEKYLDKTFLFREGQIDAYKVRLKDKSSIDASTNEDKFKKNNK